MQDAVLSSRTTTRYLEEIRHFPILKAEEEHALAARWRGHGDESAAHQLLTSHLRLVSKIAMGYRRYGLPVSDLISEGNIGLMRAVRRFDPDKGTRFSTYALWWIKAAIQDYILRSWSLVKIGTTVNQRKLFFNLGKAKRQLSALGEGDLRPDQVSLVAEEAWRHRKGSRGDESPPGRRCLPQCTTDRRRRFRRVARPVGGRSFRSGITCCRKRGVGDQEGGVARGAQRAR